jgi:UDP-GlcNAc:undecaprenyl-phosphate GlcNAc-1-phosphate transferase
MGSAYFQAGEAFILGLGSSLVGMPVAVWAGRRFGMVTYPRLFGRGREGVSYLGGLAVAVALMGAAITASWGALPPALKYVLAGAALLLLVGLADDRSRRGGLTPLSRVVVETAIGAWLWWAALRPVITGMPWLDAVIVIFFLVAAANAFNLLDNMDGIAGTTASAAGAGLTGLSLLSGQPLLALVAAALTGACLGFLRNNLFVSRVFLGNGGSVFLGFIIAGMALELNLPVQPPMRFVTTIAVLSVPAMDTSVVVLSRLLTRRSPFEGGTDHLSHRLLVLGASIKGAAAFHAWVSALGVAAVALTVLTGRFEPVVGYLVACVIAGVALLTVNVYREPSWIPG